MGLDFDQRQQWMRANVVPPMAVHFKSYAAERYEGFGCLECHGRSMMDRRFAMPNPGLPALHPAGSQAREADRNERPKAYALMEERVVPEMSALLNERIDCFRCHPAAN